MKKMILSDIDARMIEAIIVRYGRIVSIHDLLTVFNTHYKSTSAHNRIQQLTESGWFIRIKQGLYLLNESLSLRYQSDISLLAICSILNKHAYISLAHALNYFNMFDQLSYTMVAFNTQQSKKYEWQQVVFKFVKIKPSMYYGFIEKTIDQQQVKIAESEKALIDYLYIDQSFSTASLVFEKLSQHQQSLDMEKIQEYAARSSETIKRKMGFFLDQLNVNTSFLYAQLKTDHKSYSRFTSDSSIFNAKWRLYYDQRIIE
jgi:predicted transcriptional regulator of viral defense system